MLEKHDSPANGTSTIACYADDGTLIAVSAPIDDGAALREAYLLVAERVRKHEAR